MYLLPDQIEPQPQQNTTTCGCSTETGVLFICGGGRPRTGHAGRFGVLSAWLWLYLLTVASCSFQALACVHRNGLPPPPCKIYLPKRERQIFHLLIDYPNGDQTELGQSKARSFFWVSQVVDAEAQTFGPFIHCFPRYVMNNQGVGSKVEQTGLNQFHRGWQCHT